MRRDKKEKGGARSNNWTPQGGDAERKEVKLDRKFDSDESSVCEESSRSNVLIDS